MSIPNSSEDLNSVATLNENLPEAVLTQIKSLTETVEYTNRKINEVVEASEKSAEDLRKSPFGVPHARKGEGSLNSRPYSFLKAFGLIAGQLQPEDCKVEVDLNNKLKNYHNAYNGYKKQPSSVMVPFASQHIVGDENLAKEVRDLTIGKGGYDHEEVYHVRKQLERAGYTKAMSWLDESVGGSLVAPPMMGELIELLRNNEVLMAAGAKVLPMPPQGRITYPRHTSAMTAYHVGESATLTPSDPGTGDLVLSAKKLTILAKIPNELFHFSAIPIEAFIREDMAKVMALKMDKTLLEDVGSGTAPKGLINYSNILSHTANTTGANGDTFSPKDVYQMIAKVEEKNAVFNAFIMRPLLYASIVNKRADAVAADDGMGAFLFNVWREAGSSDNPQRMKIGNLSGYNAHKSTQISIVRDKSAGTDLTYVLGGDFTDYIIAMGGAIEFALSSQGDTPFTADQTWFRGVTYYDGAPRHENSFIFCDDLIQSF